MPHDFVPAQREEWCFEGTLVFYGSFSDSNGAISRDFVANWSYPHAPPEDNSDQHPFVSPSGAYNVRFVLNESAHNPVGYGGLSTARWRGVLIDWDTAFEISDVDSAGDAIGDACDNCSMLGQPAAPVTFWARRSSQEDPMVAVKRSPTRQQPQHGEGLAVQAA